MRLINSNELSLVSGGVADEGSGGGSAGRDSNYESTPREPTNSGGGGSSASDTRWDPPYFPHGGSIEINRGNGGATRMERLPDGRIVLK